MSAETPADSMDEDPYAPLAKTEVINPYDDFIRYLGLGVGTDPEIPKPPQEATVQDY